MHKQRLGRLMIIIILGMDCDRTGFWRISFRVILIVQKQRSANNFLRKISTKQIIWENNCKKKKQGTVFDREPVSLLAFIGKYVSRPFDTTKNFNNKN